MTTTVTTPTTDPIFALAASPAYEEDGLCFAAHGSGLLRSTDGGRTWHDAYAALDLQAPLTTTCVAFSPDFARDRTLFAGAPGGILRSSDGGESWTVSALPSPPPFPTALTVSPHYRADGLVFTATMEDGVLRSWDRGNSWAAWNFGLLDLDLYALVASATFALDETLYVGAESGVFCSTNGGRAWRETAFPMDAAPVLSLALEPDQGAGGSIWAGTEAHGLWRSADGGDTWEAVTALANVGAVNLLLIDPALPGEPRLLALVGSVAYLSPDGGRSWQRVDMEHGRVITSVAAAAGLGADRPLLLGAQAGEILVLT